MDCGKFLVLGQTTPFLSNLLLNGVVIQSAALRIQSANIPQSILVLSVETSFPKSSEANETRLDVNENGKMVEIGGFRGSLVDVDLNLIYENQSKEIKLISE